MSSGAYFKVYASESLEKGTFDAKNINFIYIDLRFTQLDMRIKTRTFKLGPYKLSKHPVSTR